MALVKGPTSIDELPCCPPPASCTAEAPLLELLPRVVAVRGLLLFGVGVVLCASASACCYVLCVRVASRQLLL